MSENNRPDGRVPDKGDFIRETIEKKKPETGRRLWRLGCLVVVLGILFGVVAGIAFVLSEHAFRDRFGGTSEPPKISVTFSADTAPESTSAEFSSGRWMTEEKAESTETEAAAVPDHSGSAQNGLPEETESADETGTTELSGSESEPEKPAETAQESSLTTEGASVPDSETAATEEGQSGSGSSEETGETAPENYTDAGETTIAESTMERLAAMFPVQRIASLLRPSMVTVTSVQADEDVFNQTYTHREETFGVILAITEEDVRILTESDLLEKADSVRVTLNNGYSNEASLVGLDRTAGLAVVALPIPEDRRFVLTGVSPAVLANSYHVQAGDMVVALGSPVGYVPSVAWGIISYVEKKVQGVDVVFQMLRSDIVGDEDGSGVFVNANGEVVGWITRKFREESGVHLLAAYSISELKELLEHLSNGDRSGRLGIYIQEVPPSIAEKQSLPEGLYITDVQEDSPALEAGIQEGDILTGIEGEPVLTAKALRTALFETDPEDEVALTVMRKGRDGWGEHTIRLTLAER